MTKNMPNRKRAVVEENSAVGKHRREIYKSAFKQIKAANEAGFYLEAITLIESLITDRLESRLSYLDGKDFSFKTIGKLIEKSIKIETDSVLKILIEKDLRKWADGRNKSLHEMAKIAEGDFSSWDDRYFKLKNISTKGMTLLRKIDRRCEKLKK
jgi:hypothetical protein